MIFPAKEPLRAMLRNGQIQGGYLLVAVGLYQLVEDGAQFVIYDTCIGFAAAGVCDWCSIPLPADSRIANYFIDIITTYTMANEDIIEVVREAVLTNCKVRLLMDERVRIYNPQGVTMRTIPLENYDEETQMEIVDLIMPFLE